MFELTVSANFSSAHMLRKYKGKCANLHGHNWKVELLLKSNSLDSIGMIKDAGEVKKILGEFLKTIDHKFLNDMGFFKKNNPTSENIAKYIFIGLKKELPALKKVCVRESETVSVSYER